MAAAKILIIGGTGFLGRHLTEAALAGGHEVSLFNRGRTAPGLFPGVEVLTGDRDRDAGKLKGGLWDAVIDTCAYRPGQVEAAADALRGAVGHYTLISSVSVYADFSAAGLDEAAATAAPPDPEPAEIGEHYGALKAACERAAETAFPGRCLKARPGLIVGPHDASGRFTYWPLRLSAGGEVLAPGRPGGPVQWIDARDLAAWIVGAAARWLSGTFNAAGPREAATMEGLLEACSAAAGSRARLTWVGEEFLLSEGVGPWMELPLWLPGDMAGMLAVDNSRAVAEGLSFRPAVETARDTLAWARRVPKSLGPGVGLSRAREAELLERWKART